MGSDLMDGYKKWLGDEDGGMGREEVRPLTALVAAMMVSDEGCRICTQPITTHEILGDQVLAANWGGAKQMHRLCWEILSEQERNELRATWATEDAIG